MFFITQLINLFIRKPKLNKTMQQIHDNYYSAVELERKRHEEALRQLLKELVVEVCNYEQNKDIEENKQ